MASRYRHDYAAFDIHVLCAPFMVEEMGKRAARVLARAEVTAPFDPDSKDGTHYRDAFTMEAFVGLSANRTLRAIGRVSNSDAAALIVEFGNKNTPRHRTLGNALDAAK